MSGVVLQFPGYENRQSVAKEHARNAVAAMPAEKVRLTHWFILVWLVGISFGGKGFAYTNFGGLFITELLLVWLSLEKFRSFKVLDFLFVFACSALIYAGWRAHGDLFFAIKDMSWMYYLFFLRVFPADFPKKWASPLMFVFLFGFIYSAWGRSFGLPWADPEKYRSSIVALFLVFTWAGFYSFSRSLWAAVLLLAAAVVINYKTLIIVAVAFPFLYNFRREIVLLIKRRYMVPAAVFSLFILGSEIATSVLEHSINTANWVLEMIGVGRVYTTGTAFWRADLWTRSVEMASYEGRYLFGFLPGSNIMAGHILGWDLNLSGGNELGVVRSVHSIIVQMFIKTGLVGICIWFYYAGTILKPYLNPRTGIFFLTVLLFALTADVLEVPSRAPLFYFFLVVLGTWHTNKIKVRQQEPKARRL